MFQRLRGRMALRRRRQGFRSAFGGLWTDRLDASERLAAKEVERELQSDLESWIREGYLILEGAVDVEALELLDEELDGMWATCAQDVLVEFGGRYERLAPEHRNSNGRLVDLHARFAAARALVFSPRLLHFLRCIFEDEVLAFQSLLFSCGSEQPLHQDTAYVVVESPMEFAASWIALEDVREGSGELVYYAGSHRLTEHLFSGVRNWNRDRDGEAEQLRYEQELPQRAEALGLERRSFLPRRGDVLLWSADLVHGGGPVRDRSLSRKSLVTHYCPSKRRPYYASYLPDRRGRGRDDSGAEWMSRHYPL